MQTRFAPRTTALLLLVMCAAATSCATRSPVYDTGTAAMSSADARGTAAIPAELSSAHPALLRAWQGDDPLAMRPYYADNAVIVTSNDRYTGWNDMQTRWLTPLLPGMSNFMAWPTNFTRERDAYVETGRIAFTTTQQGNTQNVSGTYTQRWQRSPAGLWRVVSANITTNLQR